MKKLLLAVLVCALLLLAFSATAGAKTPTLKSLAKSVAALQKKATKQAKTIAALKSDLATAKQTIAAQGQTLTSAAPVLALAPYVSVTGNSLDGVVGPNIVFQGANLHVRSSASETDSSGLGNLIVGWNQVPGSAPSGYRSGSNNLVCGDRNSFPANGCFLAGYDNTASAGYASVSGGTDNTASAGWASVSGGTSNTASSGFSSVSGGSGNTASGGFSSVSGGSGNKATGGWATVSGGSNLTQGNAWGWSGGSYSTP
jgi:hypothetical protein